MSAWEKLLQEVAAGRAGRSVPTAAPPPMPAAIAASMVNEQPVPAQKPVPRRANGRRKYLMDYIPPQSNGKNPLYAAVMFARELMRDGQSPDYANGWAARKYRVKKSDVAHYTGQIAGTVAGRRR